MRFFAELSYLGTAYNGWQRQPDAPSVQAALEDALATLLRNPTPVTGAGRTDTGVHAAYYTAHFDAAQAPDLYHLNAILPPDIAVHSLRRVADDAHARFDALEREYRYYIVLRKDPFRQGTAWYYSGEPDVGAMNRAAAYMLEAEDFTTFSKLHSGNKTNLCRVVRAEWERTGDELAFTIRADRFLRNMVRATVGTLVDVGRGRITPERFGEILAARDRSLASGSAPARGLFLSDVAYPEHIFLAPDA